MKRFSLKVLRWAAIVFVTVLVLLIVFYTEEDWRGARNWAACQRDLAAKGETLDLHQLIPPGKPEDDLSKVPIFASLFEKDFDAKAPIRQLDYRLHAPASTSEPNLSGYMKGRPLDLEQWQKFYRALPNSGLLSGAVTPAQDVLQVLGRFDSQLGQIDAALSNPNAYFPVDYAHPLKGHPAYASMMQLVVLWQMRAVAHLANNETGLAEKDYLSTFKIMPFLVRDGGIVGFVLGNGMQQMSEAILWEGIHRHAWNQAQLQEMEAALTKNDFLAWGKRAFRISRATDLLEIDTPEKEKEFVENVLGFSDLNVESWVLPCLPLRPRGWTQQDKTAFVFQQQIVIDAINLDTGILKPGTLAPWSMNSMGDQLKFLYVPAAILTQQTNGLMGRTIAKTETYRRLAILACRLEEYGIAHNGQYPDKLEDLPGLPAHLNQEVLSDQPFQYHHKGDGYALYSLGWNQQDDGGVYSPDSRQGDWVWPSP